MTGDRGKKGKYYLKAGQSEGSASRPPRITSDGRADRWSILKKKRCLSKGGLLGKGKNYSSHQCQTVIPKIKAKNRWTSAIFCGMMCGYKGGAVMGKRRPSGDGMVRKREDGR